METKEFEIDKYVLSLKPIDGGFLISTGGNFGFIDDENEIHRMMSLSSGMIPREISQKGYKHTYDSLTELSKILGDFVYDEFHGEKMEDECPGIMLDLEIKLTARTVDYMNANLRDFKEE